MHHALFIEIYAGAMAGLTAVLAFTFRNRSRSLKQAAEPATQQPSRRQRKQLARRLGEALNSEPGNKQA